jgi:predicted nuclease with RNAse H fold/dephospho-CoA kinase
MAQSMLPFRDTVPDQIRPGEVRKRSPRPARRLSKPLDRRLGTALADPSRVVFLDVETTGLSWFYDELTIVGWVCDGSYGLHITGDDPAPLIEALKAGHTLVTFNGTLFDLRFLKKTLGDLVLPPVHIDLRYLAKRAGLVGGQKAIERALGLPDRVGLENMDGAEAVLLWHRYLRGDETALHRLIDYNRWDVVGMCGILDHVMDRLDVHPDLLFRRTRFAEQAYATCTQAIPHAIAMRSAGRSSCTFDAMFQGTPAESATVVGIDLTGSEARPSGWCVLRRSEAETCMISSDDDMFSRAMSERPALISIDSPLSLPFGRTRVEDDDPGRDKFGIMRRCERELKRRGVNVYPSLLPSMQGLTRRGMRLAERFRSAGMPVIESYPGAAQDIMGIPRKGAGTEFLKQGLTDFGIHGSSIDHGAGHDELDAITSALVGLFFLSGQYEALRGPSEGALIIPELKSVRKGGMVVGISGRICAGKTTSARILEQRGFAYTRFSLVIDDEVISRGEVPNRATRQSVGAEINKTHGQRWLCEKVLERVAGEKLVVVDGLRFPEDHAFFVERFGSEFVHLHIQASDGHRASRYAESEHVNSSFEMADRQPVEAKVGELVKLASAVLQNDGSIAQLTEIVLNSARMRYNGRDRECLSRLL